MKNPRNLRELRRVAAVQGATLTTEQHAEAEKTAKALVAKLEMASKLGIPCLLSPSESRTIIAILAMAGGTFADDARDEARTS